LFPGVNPGVCVVVQGLKESEGEGDVLLGRLLVLECSAQLVEIAWEDGRDLYTGQGPRQQVQPLEGGLHVAAGEGSVGFRIEDTHTHKHRTGGMRRKRLNGRRFPPGSVGLYERP
jgi:hypothetical protein